MRRSGVFFIYLGINLALLCVFFAHASYATKASIPDFEEKRKMVRSLGLTDLCLFIEARYTRHLSQADLNTPFQDYPMSFEHFPSGSLVMPPDHVRKGHEKVD